MSFEEASSPGAWATYTRALGVVAADPRWRHLHTSLGDVDNLARCVFLHPAASVLFADHWKVQMAMVAQLRTGMSAQSRLGAAAEGPLPAATTEVLLEPVVEELRSSSKDFATLWTGRRFVFRPRMQYTLIHPDLETVRFDRSVVQHPDGLWHERLEASDARTAQTLGLLDLL